jgi:hypothetical protein
MAYQTPSIVAGGGGGSRCINQSKSQEIFLPLQFFDIYSIYEKVKRNNSLTCEHINSESSFPYTMIIFQLSAEFRA